MAWKVITFLAIFALSEARAPTSEQRVKKENWLSHRGSQETKNHEVYVSAYPSYEFTYEVSDPHTHDFKGHHEQRRGDDVKGYYWLIQPDGLKRTVKYNVDKHSGFKAHVDYTKHWEGENKKQEDENNEENNATENENTEENGQENENAAENEAEEGEAENNESDVGDREENREEQREADESENQEGEESEHQEKQWGWIRGRNPLSRRNNGRRENEREMQATVGIWQPHAWARLQRNEELRQVRSGEGNKKRGHSETGKGRRRNKSKNEEGRQETQANENNERNEGNGEEQRNEGNKNAEDRTENNQKGEVIKSEYHVVIHHPKH